MPRRPRRISLRLSSIALIPATLLASCNQRPDAGPVIASAIGTKAQLSPGALMRGDTGARVLFYAVAQGLVRFDSGGQIEPGLAERWTVLDDGTSYIFRLREAEWSNGERVTARDVVRLLKRIISPRTRQPLAPYLTAIDDIVEMTPEVIEMRLKHPRPDLLKLLAQPELAIFRTRPAGGTGPFRIARPTSEGVILHPAFDPARADSDDVEEPSRQTNVDLIGESAARAITRFMARKSDLVLGGDFNNWPLIPLASPAPANMRMDPAAGLFGIAIAHRTGFLGDSANRAALAQVIDRGAIVAAFAPGWAAAETLLPDTLDSAAAPAAPEWQGLSAAERYAAARAQIQRWQKAHKDPIKLSIALPRGPGATIFYGFVGAAFRSIGVELIRVSADEPADLRLIDEVAPYDSARWYLTRACQPCSNDAVDALIDARDAGTTADRASALAAADKAMAGDTPFIVIARPLRWSLVATRLRQWQPNSRAWHPLNHLRADTI